MQQSVNYRIQHTANNKMKVVHFDRLKHCPEGTRFTHKKLNDVSPSNPIQPSQSLGFSLELIEDDSDTIQPSSPRYPTRNRRVPDRLTY